MNTTSDDNALTKRPKVDIEEEDKQVGKRARIGSASPPEDDKFLGYYCQGDWWKEGIAEDEKEAAQDQRIRSLRKRMIFFYFAQNLLKINLELFLRTGQVAFVNEAPYGVVGRVASLDYDIRESQLFYKRDLKAFRDRVEKLFEWKESEHGEYMAPYFPLIQSSGTGKTKLMHEYRSVLGSKSEVHCELILCHHGEVGHLVSPSERDRIYSGTLDVQEFHIGEEGREKLWGKLTKLVQTTEQEKEKEKLVLLFDESQHLVKHGDGWHFRSIRWWLRGQRSNSVGVVGVFAGTNTSLANYFTEPGPPTSSRGQKHEYNEGNKLYPPFYEITTTGLASLTSRKHASRVADRNDKESTKSSTEFDIAVQYGRPLFARMQLKGNLTKCALGSILMRMRGRAEDTPRNTLYVGSSQRQDQRQQDYAILACRLQMGQVPFDFASKQVSAGYAHLTHFAPEQTPVAEIAYLPDPVCAWLAMTQMIGGCELFAKVDNTDMKPSEPPSAWSEKAIRLYSSGLCRPEKGDVGEVAAAFYMLVCGDGLRYEGCQELTKLSVSLEEWVRRLDHGNLNPFPNPDATGNPNRDDIKTAAGAAAAAAFGGTVVDTDVVTVASPGAGSPTVNFIQVCRNYLRPSLKEVQDGELLKHWYLGARACYAHASCPAYDLLIPIQYRRDKGGKDGKQCSNDTEVHYCPMLVSVKNRLLYSENQRRAAVDAMKKALESANITTGVCILLLIGLKPPSRSSSPTANTRSATAAATTAARTSSATTTTATSATAGEFKFSPDVISTAIIEVPENDVFGATNLALCSTCAGGERSEVMASHAEVALGAKQDFERLLRSQTKAGESSALFLKEIKDGYEEVAKGPQGT